MFSTINAPTINDLRYCSLAAVRESCYESCKVVKEPHEGHRDFVLYDFFTHQRLIKVFQEQLVWYRRVFGEKNPTHVFIVVS